MIGEIRGVKSIIFLKISIGAADDRECHLINLAFVVNLNAVQSLPKNGSLL